MEFLLFSKKCFCTVDFGIRKACSRLLFNRFFLLYYRPQGKVMFSQVSVILSTIGLMPTQSLLILVGYSVTCYGAVGTHPTGMFSCLHVRFLSGLDKKDTLHLTEFFAATNTHMNAGDVWSIIQSTQWKGPHLAHWYL